MKRAEDCARTLRFTDVHCLAVIVVSALASSAHADLLLTDGPDKEIKRLSSSGVLSVYASNVSDNPQRSITVDGDKNVYFPVGGAGFVGVDKILPDGTITRVTDGKGLFIQGAGIALDRAGNIYVANDAYEFNRINRLTPTGVLSYYAQGTPLDQPYGLAFDSKGNLFVSNSGFGAGKTKIVEITPAGSMSVFASVPAYDYPLGAMTRDKEGNLYVATGGDTDAIVKVTPRGEVSSFVPWSAVRGNFEDLTIDPAGNLFGTLSFFGDERVIEITTDGKTSIFADNIGNAFGIAYLSPNAVPEPASLALLGLGGLSAAIWSRCRILAARSVKT